jgi:hypothetical protein
MRTPRLFVPLLAALAATLLAQAYAATDPDGLTAVKSPTLDQVYLRPTVDLAAYHKVIVEPARVETQKGWRKSINQQREPSRWLTAEDEREMVDSAAAGMTKAVRAAFEAKGFEVVTAPGPGVLRIAPSTMDLFVNAPDAITPVRQGQATYQQAGDATLNLEIRDSVSGALVGRVVDRNTARQIRNLNAVTLLSNQFWFDAMFSAWARNCATELAMARDAP